MPEQNKKRVFQILDEINVADEKNKTSNVGICNALVEARKTKQGGHVTMGVPENVLMDLVFNKGVYPILLIINEAEYERVKNEPSIPEGTEFPIIEIVGEELVLRMPKSQLITAIESRPDADYKVVKPELLLERFAWYLKNYHKGNSAELGLSELQYLFDNVTDELYESAEDVIV